MYLRSLSTILIACGISILLVSILRGSDTISLSKTITSNKPIKIFKGIWPPRNVYLSLATNNCKVCVQLISNDNILKEWRNTSGFIDRIEIMKRGYAYLLITPSSKNKNYTSFILKKVMSDIFKKEAKK